MSRIVVHNHLPVRKAKDAGSNETLIKEVGPYKIYSYKNVDYTVYGPGIAIKVFKSLEQAETFARKQSSQLGYTVHDAAPKFKKGQILRNVGGAGVSYGGRKAPFVKAIVTDPNTGERNDTRQVGFDLYYSPAVQKEFGTAPVESYWGYEDEIS